MKKVCNICENSTEIEKVVLPYSDDRSIEKIYFLYKCCGYIVQADFLSKNEISNLYFSGYSCYKRNNIKDIVNSFFVSLRVKNYDNLIKNKNILELGCGMGDFILRASKLVPKSIEGVEISKYACDFIAKSNSKIKVFNKDIEVFVSEKKYDTIFMFHSIEHVKDPFMLVKKCSKMLNPGGHLVIETPNYYSWDRLIFGDKWFNYQVPYHTHIFSLKSIENIGDTSQFILIKCKFQKFPNTLTVQFVNFPKTLLLFIWPIYILEYFISSIFGASGILAITLRKE